MLAIDFDQVKNILCIGAHVDDIEIGCGGTLLRLLQRNPAVDVHWWVASGDVVRQAEAGVSAAAFLCDAKNYTLECKNFQDGYLPHRSADVKDAFFELRRSCEPELVFTHRLEDRHQDHAFLAELTWNTFRNHAILEYEIPKYEGDLGHPNLFVPLESRTANTKLDLLSECFPSQRDKAWFLRQNFEAILRLRGLECKAVFAEAFTTRKLVW